ncbi:MAG: NADH-quinone oxidoreductase subunit J [Dehalococcoidia bacterium]|nr:NADH-quinone oxidoreductase subunit J [Dehalococcoidia bacterium]MDP7469409.1 NADH-quinone oxidoreductase subunit J [Dehalococcoidia bacterium]
MDLQAVAFYVLAAMLVVSALAVVLIPNVFRAGLFLVLAFFAVAGLFITLGADFLGAVQILVYVGAIGVLLLLAIMLTRDVHHGSPGNRLWLPASVLGALLLGAVSWSLLNTTWADKAAEMPVPATAALGASVFDLQNGFILPLEIGALALLAVVIGAIVLVGEKK